MGGFGSGRWNNHRQKTQAEHCRWFTRSVASLERDQAAGRLPAPVRIGGSKKWRRADIEAWVAAGCPVRKAK